MKTIPPLSTVPDRELLRRLGDLLRDSRRTEADLVAHIGEVDARRLYAREASPSMFAYCTERLHLSGAEAYLRIAAARASREHPAILTMLADGRLHLTAIAMLASHLTPGNRDALLKRATHRTKRQIEELLAELAPRPDAPAGIRKLPERPACDPRQDGVPGAARPHSDEVPSVPLQADRAAPHELELRPDVVVSGGSSGLAASCLVKGTHAEPSRATAGETRPAAVEPLSPARYRIQFTASAELRDKLERLQDLMRSSVPDGDLAGVIEAAVTEKLERLEARRFGRTNAPRTSVSPADSIPSSRHVPAAVRRAVYSRDEGRCGYVDDEGRRCTARGGLEFHHRRPFGLGGDHSPTNVGLLCRSHNRHLAEIDYGRERVGGRRRSGAPSSQRSLET